MQTATLLSEIDGCQLEIATLHQRIVDLEQHIEALQADNERLRMVANFTYNWEYWVDSAGIVLYMSPACQRITGYQSAEFQADPDLIERIIHPHDRDQISLHIYNRHDKPQSYDIQFRIITCSGEQRWICHVCRPIYGPGGDWLGNWISNSDITRYKEAEAALIESQMLLQAVIDNAPLVIVVKDRQGRYLLANQQAAANLHLESEQMIGVSEYDLFPPMFVDRLLATDQQVWETAQTVEVEDTVPFDGERHTFLSIKFPLHTAQGELYAIGAIATDITERKRIEIELQYQRQFLRQIIDSIPALIFARDRSGHFTLINQTMAAINGATVEDLLGKTDADILSLTDAELEQRQCEDDQVMATGIDLVIPERWVQDAQGQRNCFTITKRPLFATDTSVDQVLMVAMDITERKRAEDALHKSHAHLQAIFDNAAVGIFLISPDGGWLDMNHRGIQMFGYTLDELAQITYRDVLYPPRRTKHQNLLRKIRWDKQTSCRIEQRYLRKDGTIFWGDLSMTAIYDDQGNVHAILGVLVNITRSKEAEDALQCAMKQLRQQSIRDALTGLFNRRYLDETLPRELQRAMRQQQPVGLIMLDIDYFKRCNDTYGHAAGDTLLQAVGLFLQAHTRGEDIICRYGGEEFILVLPGAPLEATWKRATEIRMGIKRLAVSHQGMALAAVTVSLGVAVFPNYGETADSLIKAADRALYQAKRSGRDRVIVAAQTDNHLV